MRFVLACYWGLLAVSTHWPRLDVAEVLRLESNSLIPLGVDKWAHVGAYAVLAMLVMLTGIAGRTSRRRWGGGVMLIAIYALLDEGTQQFVPGRTALFTDILANLAGILLGAGLAWLLLKLSRKPQRLIPPSETRADVGESGATQEISIAPVPEPGDQSSFISHARLVAAWTLISRMFGLVRDWALAWTLGFGWVMDAFVIAFMVPNLFRRLFGEGALAGAFIPQFAKLHEHHPGAARTFARRILRWMLVGLGALAGAASVVLVVWLAWFADSLDERGMLIAGLTAVTIWYMPLVCITAILGAMLQTYGRFAVPAAAPVILNLAVIGTAMICFGLGGRWADPIVIAWLIAGSVVIAGLIQAGWSVWAVKRHAGQNPVTRYRADANQSSTSGSSTLEPDPVRQATSRLLRQWGPTTLGLAVLQLNTLADSLIALFFSGSPGQTFRLFSQTIAYPMELGAIAVLGATSRLYEFPLGVFGVAVATAIFPALSAAARDRDRLVWLFHRGVRVTMFIGLPATAGLLLVREPLAEAIYFEGGRLDAGDAIRVADVLLGYAVAVWAYALNHLLVRTFYACEQATTPMKVSLCMVGLNVLLNLTLIWPLGVAGLAWSTAGCAILQCFILFCLVKSHIPDPITPIVGRGLLRIGLVTLTMSAVVWVLGGMLPETNTRLQVIGELAILVITGGGVMLGLAWLLRLPELTWLLARRVA